MTENPLAANATEERLRLQIEAYHSSALVYAAARLGLPETMTSGEWTATQLADELGLSPPHLFRFLRVLSTIGICEERPNHSFALTPAGHALKPGSSSRLREKVMIVVEQYWQPWANLIHSLKTGEPAFELVFGMDVWEWRRVHGAQGALFDTYYAPETARQAEAIIGAPAFASARIIADIGGGSGALIAAIVGAHAHLTGILFDQPQTIARARPFFQSQGWAGRVELVAGDFTIAIPVEADLYLLKSVLHDWEDAECRTILANCRATMPDGAKLLVIERLLPERAADDPTAIMIDVHMMVVTGGRERSLNEYQTLLAKSGFAVSDMISTPSRLSIIEAVPA